MSSSTYASRKRKKPQKSVKPPPDGAKSNPSKRHRERLNGELDRLASLLPYPQDVISKLDKLTVLRLCVSYLRAKSFFSETLKSTPCHCSETNVLKKHGTDLPVPEGELILQVLNGFVLVVTAGGTIFYASPTIQEYLGFQQSDVIHQSVNDFIHTEDRAEFQRQLHWALNPSVTPDTGLLITAPEGSASTPFVTVYDPQTLPPENSAFLERNFVCRLRCLHDSSSGFLALNFQGRLKFLHGQNQRTKEGKAIPPQLALFSLASPLQPPTILEIRTKNFIFRTKHKLDFTPTACDTKGRMVLGYTEAELCYRGSGYQFIHAADMLYCAENHLRMMKTGESGMTVFRLLTKLSGWVWVQANARLVYKNGQAECIIASQRVITDEEGEENLKKRTLDFPFNFTTGEALLYDSSLPKAVVTAGPGGDNDNRQTGALDPNSLLGSLLKQDESIYISRHTQNELLLQLPQEDVPGLPEEGCGGIFSSSWQEGGLLSLSESLLFKQESLEPRSCEGGGFSSEDRDWDLSGFMRNLGVSREDLLPRNDIFLDVDLDACRDGLLPDLTDEILSYVHKFLWNRSDSGQTFFPSGGATPGDQGRSCPVVPLQQPSAYQPLHPHSYSVPHRQPPTSSPQLRSPTRPLPQEATPQWPTPLDGLLLPWQQHQLNAQCPPFPWQQRQQRQQQLCDKLKDLQVNQTAGALPAPSQPLSTKQQIPLLFLQQPGWFPTPPGQAHCEHPYPREPSQDLPSKEQPKAVSVGPSQDPALPCVPSGYLEGQEAGGELTAQDLEELLGNLESGDAGGVFQQGHINDGLARTQATGPGLAQHTCPPAACIGGVNRAEPLCTTQNGSLWSVEPADPLSSMGAGGCHAAGQL
ncbi:aryl hydrocarbon receptor 1a isoform X1 [Esox lucius]|uniref:Aryl hydrocarbon receptor n=1 Tax=Esox lucius TaxID=8010 RepID=A0A3P8XSE8_ESOLU|nr:aryl hydrocarbon receptor 1a isoform X1 [Esox lucius]